MAQIVVDSQVMREKANTLETEATKFTTLYSEMLNEVKSFESRMKGTTIENAYTQFAGMQNAFTKIAEDMKSYSQFLKEAAEAYDRAESEGTRKAQEQGKVF